MHFVYKQCRRHEHTNHTVHEFVQNQRFDRRWCIFSDLVIRAFFSGNNLSEAGN